jgi:diguanylate cyclase (GGDEF)-like protein
MTTSSGGPERKPSGIFRSLSEALSTFFLGPAAPGDTVATPGESSAKALPTAGRGSARFTALLTSSRDVMLHRMLEDLGPEWSVAREAGNDEVVELIEVEDYDLLFLDMDAATGDELDLIRRIRLLRNTPIVLLGSRDSEIAIGRALTAGADDFAFMDGMTNLQVVVAHTVERARIRNAAEPTGMVRKDLTTGVDTADTFHAAYAEAVTESRTSGTRLAVIRVVVPELAGIPNAYGPVVADRVLRRVAEIVVSRVRADDLVGRMREDEFAVLLRGPGPDRVRTICDLVTKETQAFRLPEYPDLRLSVWSGWATMPEADIDLMEAAKPLLLESGRR